ncbi:AmmeMemoRadiSam system protein B, partial [Myxococcota bacterium]|nr:AmmeMemoRadiSam system protein B [Myxococcota bacterium]
PVAINFTADLSLLLDLGNQIGTVLSGIEEPFLVIATTDLTHYKPVEEVNTKDAFVIDPMVSMDSTGLFNAQIDNQVNMCGREPVIVGLEAAKVLGATKSELIMHRTSYDAYQTGEDNAVGYVSIVYSK